MWFLQNLNSTTIYYIRPEKAKHTVSRSVGELIIQGDQSISRNHAFLYPEPKTLKVVDAGSRYGTFLNEAIESSKGKIPNDVPIELKEHDRIRFGMCQSVWQVCRVEFTCITSTISVSPPLQEALRKLGGRVDDTFQRDVTRFLIMKSITTTTKLLMCLIAQIPVVKPEYFEKCVSAVETGLPFPDADRFVPEFTESYVSKEGINFTKVPGRASLFTGLVFVFVKAKHMSLYENIINLAGGNCISPQKRKIAKSFFTEPHVIVVQPFTDSMSQPSSQAVEELTQLVTSAGRRLIPDAEIGLAILVCSLEKYCNPLYKFTNILDLETVSFNTHTDILAKNSVDLPEALTPTCTKENISVPETESRDSSQSLNTPKSLSTNTTNYSDQPLKISEVVSEFIKPDEPSTVAPMRKRKRVEPADNLVKEVKKVRTKNVESEVPADLPEQVEISEISANRSSSQSSQMSGFLSVNHDEATTQNPPPAEQPKKRPLQLMLDDNGDDLFNFGETGSKRTKRQPTLAESFSTSQSVRNRSTRNSHTQNTEEDLFSFDEGNSKRSKNKSNLGTSDESSKRSTSVVKSSTATNCSTNSSYKQFIKPIQIPSEGWLSSTFCDLSIKSQHDGTTKIKEEPDGDDLDKKTRVWIDGMEAMFQVRVKAMNLTSHRSGLEGNESRGFKAFVKTRICCLFSSRNITTNHSKR
ncbi:nibrin isoform X2 [Topomyia yanbarensis]|uniref:nibrin isoform X2 n=1 Tax=Topomyia yanbarensis TaxID=2498891 RepID=UPI00273C6BAA|nr:nibrin isoform X2 [Topomyia yanbarensis]